MAVILGQRLLLRRTQLWVQEFSLTLLMFFEIGHTPIPGSDPLEYPAKLKITYKGNLVRVLRPTEINLYLMPDAAGQIQECGVNEFHTADMRGERRQLFSNSPRSCELLSI